MSLCQDIPARSAASQHYADNTLERLRGRHYPERGVKRKNCRVEVQEKKKAPRKHSLLDMLLCASTRASGLTIHKLASNYSH